MNTDNLILRQTENSPLINKEDTLTSAEFDANIIKIYNDLLANNYVSDEALTFSSIRSYVTGEYATYNGRLWVATTESTGVAPTIDSFEWNDIFPSVLAHEKNKDTYLDYGGENATSVAEIRAFIDAGLTSTTNLSLSTKTATSFKIESSTGSDVILPQATVVDAGLLNAEDKVKLDNTSGINTGDQTLESLSAEDITNKATDFTTINDALYPTTQAVDTYLTAQVPSLVEIFLDSNVELTTNKAIDFTTVNDTKYPTVKAVDDHINSKLAGLWDDRGSYDASTNLFPSTGGSGGSGAIMKGDIWTINVQGTLGGTLMHVGDTVRALTDVPGQTSTNWALLENAIGYVPENVINKVTTFSGNTTSDTKYPSVKAVVDNFSSSNIKSILGVTVLSGSNTGDQDLSTLMVKSNNLSDLTNTTTARSNLGLGSLATQSGTFSGISSGTNTGDQIISDATISLTDITTNNFDTTKHGFVPKGTNTGKFLKDDGTWGTPASGGGSGVCGIANSSGVYTYYATLSLAITAATSGQTVDLLTDITETGSVTITTKSGVKINGNGYTYTLSVNDGTDAITQATESTLEIFNIKVARTGRVSNATGRVLQSNFYSPSSLKCQNVVFESTYGEGVNYLGFIYGLNINTYGSCVVGDAGAYNCNFTSSNGLGIDNSSSAKEVINCNVKSNGTAIKMTYGNVYNSVGRCSSGLGIFAFRVVNSMGISVSDTGIGTTTTLGGNIAYNCVGISTSGVGLSGNFTNSTGISTSGYAGTNGTKTNCTLISSSNYASFQENLNNTFLQSTTNVPLLLSTGKLVNTCTALCLWDNVGGHTINTASASTGVDIRNCNLSVTNASAYCINGASASTFKYASNTFKGSTTAVNATNVAQGITNTEDNQGNILI